MISTNKTTLRTRELGAGPTRRELRRRLNSPQRHRLLQGYPMAPLMKAASRREDIERPLDESRPLIAGVLPHAFCNPKVQGCGFCTFPNEPYRADQARAVVEAVSDEIELRSERIPGLAGREVSALYFGGATANLIHPEDFALLCASLDRAFDLSKAEISFEGVPIYFLTRKSALLDLFREALPARHRRLSMGIQSFDPARLKAMGRDAFGGRAEVAAVVERAHAMDMTVSGDFLINMPGQSRAAMLADIDTAIALGLDQICVYHLVLYEGLGTAWSRDPELLSTLPANEQAYEHWRTIREHLLDRGYVQTTLTNFERVELSLDRRFQYERLSFDAAANDGIGFGPSGISTFIDDQGALKIINAVDSARYRAAIDREGAAYEKRFDYSPEDRELLHITRGLPLLGLSRQSYREAFGRDLLDHRPETFVALEEAGLITLDEHALRLSPRGMFYADTVAGLLAWPRVRELREESRRQLPISESAPHFMG